MAIHSLSLDVYDLLLLTYDEYILKKTPLALHGHTTRAIFEQVSLIVLVLP